MQTTYLIIGQGISGTWLSYWLHKAGANFLVIDEPVANSASRIASGVINPVTGRRMAKTWMDEILLPFAEKSYKELGKFLEINLIEQTPVLDFFSAPDRRFEFEKRSQIFAEYLQWPTNESQYQHWFHYPFGFGIVSPAYLVQVQEMLKNWRQFLWKNNLILEEKFIVENGIFSEKKISYKNIEADKIIFCDGVSAFNNLFFKNLPHALVKGEALIVDIPNLPPHFLYKKTNTIVPWHDGLFWVGSSYQHQYENDQPSAQFLEQTKAWLLGFLKLPFSIKTHVAGIRPGTVERRPWLGLHPQHQQVGILGGMGSKGVSLAPFFAKQLVDFLLEAMPILPEVNVQNFAKILSR